MHDLGGCRRDEVEVVGPESSDGWNLKSNEKRLTQGEENARTGGLVRAEAGLC